MRPKAAAPLPQGLRSLRSRLDTLLRYPYHTGHGSASVGVWLVDFWRSLCTGMFKIDIIQNYRAWAATRMILHCMRLLYALPEMIRVYLC